MTQVRVTTVRQNGSEKDLPNTRELLSHNGQPAVSVKGALRACEMIAPDHVRVRLGQPVLEARSAAKKAYDAAVAAGTKTPKASKPSQPAQPPSPEVQAVLAMASGNPALLKSLYATIGQQLKAAKKR